MKLLLTFTAAILLCSCAGPQMAPRFNAPSTKAVATGVRKAKDNVQTAQKQVQVIEKVVDKECPQLKLQIHDLKITLDNALASLNETEGARSQLQTQLEEQTDKANALARNYDKAAIDIAALKESRHRWVKLFLGSSGLLLASLVWIFRRPLMLLMGVI